MEENRYNPDHLKQEVEKYLATFLETKNFDQPISNRLSTTMDAILIDVGGKRVWDSKILPGNQSFDLQLPTGVYSLQLTDSTQISSIRLIRM